MNSLTIVSEYDIQDIKLAINAFLSRGMSLYQALKLYLQSSLDIHQFRLDLDDTILAEVWRSDINPDTSNGEIFYYNKRDLIIESLVDFNRSKGYLFNRIYQLRNKGFLKSEIKTVNGKRVTLIALSDEGLEVIAGMLNKIKNVFETPSTTTTQLDNNIKLLQHK